MSNEAKKERDRCVKIIKARADFWNAEAKRDFAGNCALPLAEECEDIITALERPVPSSD